MKTKQLTAWLALLLMATPAFAGATRTLDGQEITNAGAVLSLPSSTDTLVGRATTDTLTNKTISGASNTITNVSLTSGVTGTLPVGNGGTGATTFTSKGILYGNGSSAISVTSAGSQYQSLQAGSGGTPAFDAVHLDQDAAVTGLLPLTSGGTGASTQAGAANAVLPSQTSNSGKFLKTDGSNVSWATVSVVPSLNASVGSPQAVTASGGISLSNISYVNFVWVVGSPGAVTVTATPSITAGTAVGQVLYVIGTDNTKTVTLQDEAGLAGTTLQLNGSWVGAQYSVLELAWDGSAWNEVARR